MRSSVCYNCPDRKTPKTCEATCDKRRKEMQALEAERHQRFLDNIEPDSKRVHDIRAQHVKAKKQGRK